MSRSGKHDEWPPLAREAHLGTRGPPRHASLRGPFVPEGAFRGGAVGRWGSGSEGRGGGSAERRLELLVRVHSFPGGACQPEFRHLRGRAHRSASELLHPLHSMHEGLPVDAK